MFEKGGTPSLIISTLEALVVLVALKVFYAEVPTWTDNRGNGAVLNTLMTRRNPTSAVLMELASHMKASSMKVQVEWTLRSGKPVGQRHRGQVLARTQSGRRGGGSEVALAPRCAAPGTRGGRGAPLSEAGKFVAEPLSQTDQRTVWDSW